MHFFKDLEVWKLSMETIVEIYKSTDTFPVKEQFGLISQINRSAVSIAANIAEGCGRNTTNDFNHFLDISLGSSFELETLIIASQNIGYLSEEKSISTINKIHSIQKMLYALRRSTNKPR
ncbi:MAG TPA: four helix bundle protein [Bacteroidales bacterium]|nr:four helix bundle protein [Bacteroidales bacterium]